MSLVNWYPFSILSADDGFVGLGVEADAIDAPDDHARGLDRRAQLQAADIVEARIEPVAWDRVERSEVPDLQREEHDRGQPDRHENADPQVDRGAIHAPIPLNMNTVRMKSSARIASEASTTVRVVAEDTPSAVGLAS